MIVVDLIRSWLGAALLLAFGVLLLFTVASNFLSTQWREAKPVERYSYENCSMLERAGRDDRLDTQARTRASDEWAEHCL